MTFAPLPDHIETLIHDVIGAAIEVHKVLGPGHLEQHYENALCIELELRSIPFKRQQTVVLNYKGHEIGEGRIDLVVADELVVELKAVEGISNIHLAQVISYLRIRESRAGLLLNFNVPAMNSKEAIRRVIVN
ncbi:MAG: GxxExxY protein [Planctomycetota bacterium]|nr:GxxExxY protein [Planctomycetota bacterium]